MPVQNIISKLTFFELPKTIIDLVKNELDAMKPEEISITKYLDRYLMPLVDGFYNQINHQVFRDIVSLTFTGDLSIKAFNVVWKKLTKYEQIFYATTRYHLGLPLEIAARNGNLAVLKELDKTYKELLPLHKDRALQFLYQLKPALLAAGGNGHTECIEYLIKMCRDYSIPLQDNGNTTRVWQSRLNYDYESTLLIDLFADIFVNYFESQNEKSIKTLCSFLESHRFLPSEFDHFQKRVIDSLKTRRDYLSGLVDENLVEAFNNTRLGWIATAKIYLATLQGREAPAHSQTPADEEQDIKRLGLPKQQSEINELNDEQVLSEPNSSSAVVSEDDLASLKLMILSNMDFDNHLETFKVRAEEMIRKSQTNSNYRSTANAAIKFWNDLDKAKDKFLENNKLIQQSKQRFKEESLKAIETVKPVFQEEHNLKGLIEKFIVDFLSVITLGLTSKLGIFAPKADSFKKIEDEIKNNPQLQ